MSGLNGFVKVNITEDQINNLKKIVYDAEKFIEDFEEDLVYIEKTRKTWFGFSEETYLVFDDSFVFPLGIHYFHGFYTGRPETKYPFNQCKDIVNLASASEEIYLGSDLVSVLNEYG